MSSNNFVSEEAVGEALMKLGRDQEAWPHFISAASIDPRDPAPHLNLGAILATHDRPEQAVNEYETAVKLHLDSQSLGIAYEKLGDAYRELGDTAKARESYVHGVKINPQQSAIWQALARLDLEDNIRKLSQTVASNPQSEDYLRLGQMLHQSDRLNEAGAAYEHALQLNPKLEEAMKELRVLDGGGR